MTEKYSSYSLKNIGKAIVGAGLAAILTVGSILPSGCATPNCIKQRRYLGAQGRLNSSTFAQVSVDDYKNPMAKAGISVDFNNLDDLLEGTASAGTAFGYGFVRPAFREFWSSDKPEKQEYNGLAIFTGEGYQNGRKAETAGEITRYLTLIYGLSRVLSHGDSGSSGNSTTSSTTTTTTSGRNNGSVTTTTNPGNTTTTTTSPTTTTTMPNQPGGSGYIPGGEGSEGN